MVRSFFIGLVAVLVAGCSLPIYRKPLAPPTVVLMSTLTALPPTLVPVVQATINPTSDPFPTLAAATSTSIFITQSVQNNYCADGQIAVVIDDFKSALQTSNGYLLASLINPVHGLDARLYRDGKVVNYDRAHAKFLFNSTYSVDRGCAPGSGVVTSGFFHALLVPALLNVFNKNYTLTCNQIRVGGTTYQANWPYGGTNFYSVNYPGSQGNGSLDWHIWLIGMDYTNKKPSLYATLQFHGEP